MCAICGNLTIAGRGSQGRVKKVPLHFRLYYEYYVFKSSPKGIVYGKIDEHEKLVEEIAMVLSSLFFACKREEFPDWGNELLEELKNGFNEKLEKMLN